MTTENKIKKTLRGTVVSDAMDKTVVVEVGRYVKHPKYKKFYTINKKYHAHDEQNQYKIGDKVEITETKPISKKKSFIVASK
ncbi:MAG: 30S ribosomal protein S17 [Candidatus Pacebacteria bacterium]|nr:30S ribosomal protein S17 [Candidatus Paceibacterota bacterium]